MAPVMRLASGIKWLPSRLTAKILAITIFPVIAFLIGVLVIDDYRITLIEAELEALQRQGITLARSLALEEASKAPANPGQLSAETMKSLLPLVGYGSNLRARVFNTKGVMIADTMRLAGGRPFIRLERRRQESMHRHMFDVLFATMLNLTEKVKGRADIQTLNIRAIRRAQQLPDITAGLRGKLSRSVFKSPRGHLVLAVTIPVYDLRVIKGALLVTTTGGSLEQKIATVNSTFFTIFLVVLGFTALFGVFLSRSIVTPIKFLAHAADSLRQSKDPSASLRRLPDRKDEIGQLSTSLVALTEELQSRIKATASFAADVSHEIKNPLASLRSAVETIARIDDARQQQRLMDVILNDVQRIDRLITDISAASRLDAELSGELPPPSNLTEMLLQWTQILDQQYQHVAFKCDITPDRLMVAMHGDRIIQVLDNIVSNAVSFHPSDRQLPILISLSHDKAGAIISISDNGPGIAPNMLERIFERFYTERPNKGEFGEHSGLGLAISRQIAVMHGGSLTADNKPEGGAVFTLKLPLAS